MRKFKLLLILSLWGWTSGARSEELEKSLLRVYSHVQKPDYDAPWASKGTEKLTHMGVVVDAEHVLVAAYAVAGGRHYEVEKLGDSRQYPMELVFVDPAVDLALLRFTQDKPSGLKALTLGEDLEVGANATLYQGLEGESLITSQLRLREVEVKPIFLTGYPAPHYVFELKRSGYGWFEPLIRNQKLFGAALAQSGSLVYVLPSRIIGQFLKKARRKPYVGFAEIGFRLSSLTSPALRKWAHAEGAGSQQGAWIHSIKSGSSFDGKLHDGDILLEFNGTPVSSRGSYEHPRWGRISVLERMSALGAGDDIQLKILRAGKVLKLKAKAQRFDALQEPLESALGNEPDYLIFGGLLLQELSRGLLESWGAQWRKKAPLPYLFAEQSESSLKPGQRFVVLQRVFPLEYNKGYHDLEDDFVIEVNGRPISSLASLREALASPADREAGYARIKLGPGGDEVILSYKGLAQVNATLQQRFAIPHSAHFWQETSIEPKP